MRTKLDEILLYFSALLLSLQKVHVIILLWHVTLFSLRMYHATFFRLRITVVYLHSSFKPECLHDKSLTLHEAAWLSEGNL